MCAITPYFFFAVGPSKAEKYHCQLSQKSNFSHAGAMANFRIFARKFDKLASGILSYRIVSLLTV